MRNCADSSVLLFQASPERGSFGHGFDNRPCLQWHGYRGNEHHPEGRDSTWKCCGYSRIHPELDCQELVPRCCCCTDIHHKRRQRNKTWYVVAIMQSHIFESFETTMRCFGKSNWASQLFSVFSYGLLAVRVKQLMLYTCSPFKLQSWKSQIWGIRGTNIRNEHSMMHDSMADSMRRRVFVSNTSMGVNTVPKKSIEKGPL